MYNILTAPRQHRDRPKTRCAFPPRGCCRRALLKSHGRGLLFVRPAGGGNRMSSRLSPALAEFSEGRWPDERGMDPRQRHPREFNLRDLNRLNLDPRDLDPLDPRSMEPPLHPRELDRGPSSVSRWVPVAFVRF